MNRPRLGQDFFAVGWVAVIPKDRLLKAIKTRHLLRLGDLRALRHTDRKDRCRWLTVQRVCDRATEPPRTGERLISADTKIYTFKIYILRMVVYPAMHTGRFLERCAISVADSDARFRMCGFEVEPARR